MFYTDRNPEWHTRLPCSVFRLAMTLRLGWNGDGLGQPGVGADSRERRSLLELEGLGGCKDAAAVHRFGGGCYEGMAFGVEDD